MNKVAIQAFSSGIIFATAIMAGFYYGNNLDEQTKLTTSDAKKILIAKGYNITKPSISNRPEQVKTNSDPKNVAKGNKVTENNGEIEKNEKVISYILKVKSKMTTSEIADLLEKEKIIEDAPKFQDYMNKEKLSRQVQIGEYIVSSNMSYQELGKLITKQ